MCDATPQAGGEDDNHQAVHVFTHVFTRYVALSWGAQALVQDTVETYVGSPTGSKLSNEALAVLVETLYPPAGGG